MTKQVQDFIILDSIPYALMGYRKNINERPTLKIGCRKKDIFDPAQLGFVLRRSNSANLSSYFIELAIINDMLVLNKLTIDSANSEHVLVGNVRPQECADYGHVYSDLNINLVNVSGTLVACKDYKYKIAYVTYPTIDYFNTILAIRVLEGCVKCVDDWSDSIHKMIASNNVNKVDDLQKAYENLFAMAVASRDDGLS